MVAKARFFAPTSSVWQEYRELQAPCLPTSWIDGWMSTSFWHLTCYGVLEGLCIEMLRIARKVQSSTAKSNSKTSWVICWDIVGLSFYPFSWWTSSHIINHDIYIYIYNIYIIYIIYILMIIHIHVCIYIYIVSCGWYIVWLLQVHQQHGWPTSQIGQRHLRMKTRLDVVTRTCHDEGRSRKHGFPENRCGRFSAPHEMVHKS